MRATLVLRVGLVWLLAGVALASVHPLFALDPISFGDEWRFLRGDTGPSEPANTWRQAGLWRKSSFGTQSERGARYGERILTVCATCRLQGRSIIAYLRDACRCHLNAMPAPLPINTATQSAKVA